MKTYQIKVTCIEPLLGTTPMNKEVFTDYIGSLNPEGVQADEVAAVPEMLEKGTTGFFRMPDGRPAMMDYQIKGFFKDAASMLRRDPDSGWSKVKAHIKIIDGLVFVTPRFIPLSCAAEAIDMFERPLRGQTAQGERICLARSERAPIGTTLEFKVLILAQVTENLLRELLVYGALRGLGQFRNGGWGRVEYEMTAL